MPKIAKRFFVAGAVVLAAAILILLCINLYLQSGGVQQRIRDAASRALGVELKIKGTSYTPWNGLVLRDITIPSPIIAAQDIIDAKTLRIRFALFPLFERRFVITECTLFDPHIVVQQMENGDWLAPLPPKAPPRAPTPEEPAAAPHPGAVFRAELDRFRIYGGMVDFIDAKKQNVLKLEKVEMDAVVAPDMHVSGTVSIDRAFIANDLKPRKINSPFSWDGQVLDLPQMAGSLAGGSITGSYRAIMVGNPWYRLNLNVNGVMLKKLFADANLDTGKTEGQLKGTLSLNGDPRKSSATTGTGHFELVRAQLKPMDFLVQLGQLLQVDELQLLRLSQAKLDITIKDEKVWIDNLDLQSTNLILRGHGPIRFNHKLNLDAKLMIDHKLQEQLQGVLGKNLQASDDPNYHEVNFTVSGRLEAPKTDLLDKLIGLNIGDNVGGMLKGLFHFAPVSTAPTSTPAPAGN